MASNNTNTTNASTTGGSTSRSKASCSNLRQEGRTSSSGADGDGAAAEPEPSEVPSTRTAATAATTYNVRDYQNPDAGAADLPLIKTAKGKADDKGKKGGTTTVVCFNCGRAAPKLLRCGQCHHAHYCGPEVSPMRAKG